MKCKELIMSGLLGKKPMFLQVGVVAVFVLCMVAKPLYAQETPDTVKQVKEPIFVLVEQMPEFPGGDSAHLKFLQENLIYPQKAKEKKLQGSVVLHFIVETDGSIANIKVIRSSGHPILDEEALRVAKLMPNWIPGKQRGKPVRVIQPMSIKFPLK